jgi:hypothetical protein
VSDAENGSRDAAHDLELWLVHAIEQLPGVLAAAVWLNDLNHLRAVHVTAAPNASTIIIANATARILRTHGLQFAPESIRVVFRDGDAQPAGTVTAAAAPATVMRFLLLHDMSLTRAGSRVTCTVQVERGPAVFEG